MGMPIIYSLNAKLSHSQSGFNLIEWNEIALVSYCSFTFGGPWCKISNSTPLQQWCWNRCSYNNCGKKNFLGGCSNNSSWNSCFNYSCWNSCFKNFCWNILLEQLFQQQLREEKFLWQFFQQLFELLGALINFRYISFLIRPLLLWET